MKLVSGEAYFDDEDLGGAVVDWRDDLREGDGVMDESEETPTTTNSVKSDGRKAGKDGRREP